MPRVRKPALVVTFPSTAAAMSCEELCAKEGLPGRMIPVPGEISAGCGLAWKAEPAQREVLEQVFSQAGVAVEAFSVIEMLEFVKQA